ncbi:MAG: hypothetical protein J5813_02740 [Candidatus Methanomethylophilaceae archaeon]|nr:hypothetical protein [Candidatus Methanomethylophilaceae archaeon]
MVRFTLKHTMTASCIKMDLPDDELLQELNEIIMEYWGSGKVVLIRGYDVLDADMEVGRVLKDGDVIEAIQDPRCLKYDSCKGRIQLSDPYGGTWSIGSAHRQTS